MEDAVHTEVVLSREKMLQKLPIGCLCSKVHREESCRSGVAEEAWYRWLMPLECEPVGFSDTNGTAKVKIRMARFNRQGDFVHGL